MNPLKLIQVKQAWDKFNQTHPKLMPFIRAVGNSGMHPGTVIEISVTTPEGQNYTTNIKVCESDLELIESIKEAGK
ncbi:MAG: hypothetical protein ACI4GD_13715 [Lachnospiraceae bacterium]